jgi:hypothetical protein
MHRLFASSKQLMRILRGMLSRPPTSCGSAAGPISLIAAEYARSPSVTTLRGRVFHDLLENLQRRGL